MMLAACDLCKKTETEVELAPYILEFSGDRRVGVVCPDDGKRFVKLLALLPPPQPKRRRRTFDDTIRRPDPEKPSE